jgi:hypothetical protein
MACAASMSPPLDMAPDRIKTPSNSRRISLTSANGLNGPAWPPAPAHTAMMPSTPCSIAFCRVPQADDIMEHQAAVTVHGVHDVARRTQARNDDGHLVPHAGFHVRHEAGVTAVNDLVDGERRNGRSRIGLRIRSEACLALSAGNEPTMPAVHWATTRSGTDTINIGAPMSGTRSLSARDSGNATICVLFDRRIDR